MFPSIPTLSTDDYKHTDYKGRTFQDAQNLDVAPLGFDDKKEFMFLAETVKCIKKFVFLVTPR